MVSGLIPDTRAWQQDGWCGTAVAVPQAGMILTLSPQAAPLGFLLPLAHIPTVGCLPDGMTWTFLPAEFDSLVTFPL